MREHPLLLESYRPADTAEPLWDITLSDLLRAAAREVPNRPALVEGTPDPGTRRRWTYAQLLDDAEHLARALLAHFAPGERVAVYAPNSAEWLLLQHGMSLAGILLVPLNPAYRAAEVSVILRNCEAAGIFYSPTYRGADLAELVAH